MIKLVFHATGHKKVNNPNEFIFDEILERFLLPFTLLRFFFYDYFLGLIIIEHIIEDIII